MPKESLNFRDNFTVLVSLLLLVCALLQAIYTYSPRSHEMFIDDLTPTWAIIGPILFWFIVTLVSLSAILASIWDRDYPNKILKWIFFVAPLILSTFGLVVSFLDAANYFSVR